MKFCLSIIEVLNSIGQVVYSANTGSNELTVDSRLWPSGLYHCHVISKDNKDKKGIIHMK